MRRTEWITVAALFAIALVVRVVAAGQVHVPPTEGSAYYLGVARNLVAGHGLVSDSIWSYATPPLVLPKPAFELWLPMASFVGALGVALFGSAASPFSAAQLATALLGAAVAPLAWYVARDAARRHGLPERRVAIVAASAGILAAVLGSFLEASVGPDSTVSFTVFAVLAACLVPPALEIARGRWTRSAVAAGVALGAALGLAYLSRQEAVYIAVAYVVLIGASARSRGPRAAASTPGEPRDPRPLWAARALGLPALGGAAVVLPWLLRDLAAFGTLFPGQAIENLWFTRNEQVFAFADRPTATGFLAQGFPTIVAHQLTAFADNLVNVVGISAAPAGIVGLIALVALRRSPAIRANTVLRALLLSGSITFVVTSVAFPVASVWGTFRHAAGPLLVALTVLSALGLDAAVAWVHDHRHWSRENAWLGPVFAVAVAAPLAAFQVAIISRQAAAIEARFAAVRGALPPGPIITDQPMWLAELDGVPALALPDEDSGSVYRLARAFRSSAVVLIDRDTPASRALVAAAGPRHCLGAATAIPLPDGATARLMPLAAAGCIP